MFNKAQVEQVPVGQDHLVLAKYIKTDNLEKYLLKIVDNMLINPCNYSEYELKKGRGTFAKTDKDTYDTYHKIINGKSAVPFRTLESRL